MTYEYCINKADQHYEMAGLARQDRDTKDEIRHIELAREWDRKAKELKNDHALQAD